MGTHSGTSSLNPELERYRRQYREINRETEDIVTGLSRVQFNWCPHTSRWSIGQCVEHLSLTLARQLPVLDEMIEKGRSGGLLGEGPFRHGFLGNFIIRLVEPPPRKRVKSSRLMKPPRDLSPGRVLPEFLKRQEQLDERLHRADGLHLARIRMKSEFNKFSFYKFSLGQWFSFIGAHERRHLYQMHQVRNQPDFPHSG